MHNELGEKITIDHPAITESDEFLFFDLVALGEEDSTVIGATA